MQYILIYYLNGFNDFIYFQSGIAGECKVHNLGTINYKLDQVELRKFSDMSNCSKFIHEMDSTSSICQDKYKV
jgi:hypothetical protein